VRLRAALNWWLEAFGGFFYPNVCQCCCGERAGAAEGYVGARCRGRVRWCQPPICCKCGLPYEGDLSEPFECANCRTLQLHFDWARAAVCSGGVVLEVIHRYKYRRERWFEPFLGRLLVRAAEPTVRARHWDWLVPVPLHPVKEREREFNQAACLARWLALATGVPMARGVLRRSHYTSTQTRLGRGRRRENVVGAFQVSEQVPLDGRRLILIDDVLTTGATTSECARVLKEYGADEVGVWTVARGV